MTKLLNRDDILRADDIKSERIDMARFGWPGEVIVRGLTGTERGEIELLMSAMGTARDENHKKFRALILVRSLVDEAGSYVFRGQDDVDALSAKSAAALDYLTDVAQRLSGYRQADIEAITKNSPGGQSEGSTTD